MLVTAMISWKPSFDMTCGYDLICYSPESKDMEVTQIRDREGLFTYNLDNLTFATVYKIGIRATNTNDISKESTLMWEEITTPSCTEWHNMNFNICAPFRPEELSVKEDFLLPNNIFSLNISWKLPRYKPDYYTLRLLDLDQLHTYNVKKYDYNISKDENLYIIPNLTLNGMLFEIHLTAHTPGGNSTAIVTKSTYKPHLVSVSPDRNYILKLGIAIFAPLFCIAILSLTVFVVCHRRAKLKRFQERCKYFEELEKKAPIDPKSTFEFTKTLTLPHSQDDIHQFQLDLEDKLFFNDDMEINRDDVKLYEILGEGAFGLVRRGIYHNRKQDDAENDDGDGDGSENTREVAVKMLKDQPSVDDVRAFRREIEVMKSVGRHPNIVGIIGHCTRKCNEMLLLTEYCSFGNLLIFLRNEWKFLHELSFRNKNHSLKTSKWFGKQNQQQQQQQQYPLSTTPSISSKTPNQLTKTEFNFDPIAMQPIKLKCTNVNSISSTASTAYVESPTITATPENTAPPPPPPPPPTESPPLPPLPPTIPPDGVNINNQKPVKGLAKFNKSYGYEEICTSACKCRVDILPSSPLASSCGDEPNQRGQIKISRKCECKLKRNKLFSVDNEGYYKNFTSQNLTSKIERDKDQQQQQQTALENDDLENQISGKREPLRTADLLEIAKQVAMGMEFLCKNKVVHRDLAARNVLVSADRTVKIADFGLSRDVYQENVYKKTGNGKLPIKWLALESMTHQVYTSQSDVWSFGILLYEIITLGGIPYPSIPTNRLIHLLKTGYRMEKPKNCSQGLYNLMMACWNFNPAERPNFTEIINILDCMSSESPPPMPIENLHSTTPTTQREKHSPETPSSDESYLKPL
ncbi:tyrosine-protein kinase receptor torso isoform X2 [Episyrphus balteatus]|nr:tyrosine-protein kinase receptor torso isoform X2 [Episyrphus balteatus]